MSIKKQLDEIKILTDHLLAAADKLTDSGYRNPKSTSKHHDPRLLRRFKQVEVLAHEEPYVLTKKTKTTEILDEDGVKRIYQVSHIPSRHHGLVGFILQSEDPENPRMHVVFRGTHSVASASRNLETFGINPGGRSFKNERDSILQTIKKAVEQKQQNSSKPIELSIAGHSLGGSDAQKCAVRVLDDIANATHAKPSPLSKLGAVNIMLANSAGVSAGTAKKSKACLAKMHRRNLDVKVNMFVCMVDGDPVQQAGHDTILADSPKDQLNVYLLKADIGEHRKFARMALILKGQISIIAGIIGGYRAHTVLLFDEKKNTRRTKKANVTMKIYHNQAPSEDLIITQQLQNKLYRKLGKVFNPVRFIKSLVNAINTATKEPKAKKHHTPKEPNKN